MDAKKIRKINPWLIELIKRGEITIPKAKRILGIGPVQVTASLNPKAPGDKKILEFFAKTPKEKKSDAVKAILEREISGTAIH